LAAQGQEAGQRVEDDEVDAAAGAEIEEVGDEVVELGGRGPGGEGPIEEADVAAEGELLAAWAPEGAIFLGDDGGDARSDGPVEQGRAGLAMGQEVCEERGLAGFGQSGQERELARTEQAGPDP